MLLPKNIKSSLMQFRHLIKDIIDSPEILGDDILKDSSYYKLIYPCEVIDLRKILENKQITGEEEILLFSVNFAQKYLKKYPVFLLLNINEVDNIFTKYGGLRLYKTSKLDIDSALVNIIVNEPISDEVKQDIVNIVSEIIYDKNGINKDFVIFSNKIPGITSS